MEYKIITLREEPHRLAQMARWFEHTFGISEAVYRESMLV